MKATIDDNGMLVITPENGIENYALQKWVDENIDELTEKCALSIDKLEQ